MEIDEVRAQYELFQNAGITGITEEKIVVMEQSLKKVPKEMCEVFDCAYTILSDLGHGHYDKRTGAWIPNSNTVFCFDMEISDISHMFRDVLDGIQAISDGDFVISEVEEYSKDVNKREGSGKQMLRFLYNGHPYEFEGRIENDWFDIRFIRFFNDVLENEENTKRLWVTSDGYQDIYLFYNNEFWARKFKKITGLELETP